ncbi:uncharacterized protein [Dermacentor albipictus]|uniref:uncharacterized protein n=1 Tax=Dermacentor albipictus TaxID=60249 RepID=UPI0038FC2611
MLRLKEKPYTRKRASLETKMLFEDFGSRTGSQQSTAREVASAEMCSGACTTHACVNTCGRAVPANICVPCDSGRCTEATSEVQAAGCDTARTTDNVPCFLDGSTLSDSSDGSLGSPVRASQEDPLGEVSVGSLVSRTPEPTFDLATADSSSVPSDFAERLRSWAIKENVTHTAVTSLLKMLKTSSFDPSSLPSDARTLLSTPRGTQRAPALTDMAPGQYCHFGLQCSLENALSEACFKGSHVSLLFNIDGLPISKSSNMQLWPIQCMIGEHGRVSPFVVGIFAGPSKPVSANDFLSPLVSELQQLLSHGMVFEHRVIKVSSTCFVLDAPARSFVFQIKGHTGYSGCPKCTVEGTYSNNRLSFPARSSTLRTDDSFRRQTDPDHHLGTSVLMTLPIDCVASAPLDYMHLLCLGIMKKLLSAWLGGRLEVRLGPAERRRLSDLNLSLAPNVPKEFSRKPRSVAEAERWKATEFRLLLLYTGPVVLMPVLPPDLYMNFLSLHCAVYILASPSLCQQHTDYAESLLKYFVKTFARLYGNDQVSYNVHCALHVANDVRKHGPLDMFSAFPFENNMQYLKRLLKSHKTPLAQLYNRLKEREGKGAATFPSLNAIKFTKEHSDGPLLGTCAPPQYKQATFASFILSVDVPDNCCIIDGSVVIVDSFAHFRATQAPCIIGREFMVKENFYDKPFSSCTIDVYVVSQLSDVKCWPLRNVRKLVRLPWHGKFVIIPLLHMS